MYISRSISFFFIAETFDENGEKIIYNQVVAFVVGAGNFGGKKQTSRIVPVIEAPTRAPDAYFVDKTLIDQVNTFFLFDEVKNVIASYLIYFRVFVSGCYLSIIWRPQSSTYRSQFFSTCWLQNTYFAWSWFFGIFCAPCFIHICK